MCSRLCVCITWIEKLRALCEALWISSPEKFKSNNKFCRITNKLKFSPYFGVNRNFSSVYFQHCLVCDRMNAVQFHQPSFAFSTCMRAAFSLWANQIENRQPRGCASCPYPKWKTPMSDARNYVTNESISNCLPSAKSFQKYENERIEKTK